MISGTHKETAALAISKMMTLTQLQLGLISVQHARDALGISERALKLAERRELVALGKLPGSSALPFAVALDVDQVGTELNDATDMDSGFYAFGLFIEVRDALDVIGVDHFLPNLWFDAEGNAFLSFELEDDATLFRLALEGTA